MNGSNLREKRIGKLALPPGPRASVRPRQALQQTESARQSEVQA
jgi:hypothetical protein